MPVKFRDYYFYREKTVSDTDTLIVPLDVKVPISYLKIEIEATNGATSCTDHEILDDIAKIEVLDGSKVIQSLSGKDWLAANALHFKRLPRHLLSEVGAAVQEETLYIPFGRYLDDLEMYFNPARYKNPQLRISIALDVSATVGFATGTGKVTVMGRLIEEGAKSYLGYLMHKYVEEFTAGTSGDKKVEMYNDYPWRLLLVRALLTTTKHEANLSKWKLSCDADEEVPFEKYAEDIVDMNYEKFGLLRQAKTLKVVNDNTSLLDLFDIRNYNTLVLTDDLIVGLTAIDGEQITHTAYRGHDAAADVTGLEAETTSRTLQVAVDGLAPNAILGYPFYYDDVPEEYFDAPGYGRVDLYLTQAAAAACAVILQQFVR